MANGAWKNWDRDEWLRRAKEFINPIIDDLWDPDRMKDADGNDRKVDDDEIDDGESGGDNGTGEDEGVTDPAPARVKASAVKLPYTKSSPPVGKVFMDTPQGSMVCSGTVVTDPAHPGKSNLVATAGHCVHAGEERRLVPQRRLRAPATTRRGSPTQQLGNASQKEVAPDGVWWAKYAGTTDHWIKEGAKTGGQRRTAGLRRAEGAARGQEVGALAAGDRRQGREGQLQHPAGEGDFESRPARLPGGAALRRVEDADVLGQAGPSDDRPEQPTMYRVGCTMTGGSSGGGWLSPSGRQLLSVTSIGPVQGGWLAGPRIGKEAKDVFDSIAKR